MLKWGKRLSEWSKPEPWLSVVVPAIFDDPAGEGALYAGLGGVPVAAQTLLALDRIPQVTEIVVVIREAELKPMADICRDFGIRRVRKVVCAKESGLEALTVGVYECDPAAAYIAIHDPLRPFVTERIIKRALTAAERAGAGAPAVPVKDTIKIVREGVVQETPDRSALYAMQAPQVVESSLLKAALCRAREAGVPIPDLPKALELLQLDIQLTEGSDENIRVGTATDLLAAQAILYRRT